MAEGKKGRKFGHNKKVCEAYKKSDRERINKRRRLRRHLRRLPNDQVAMKAFTEAGGTDKYLNSLQPNH
jgi:hypothetical protein